ncbi:hypothetical protein MNAN1_000914 [Malassezia nana]|uniref:J domain-containing protein n=1 Tax=Malassezia nana TaxID=180528 RepID=A0AAF0J1D5_9BASI|nr:hypothetical protein MNAN1_000914 [Malassezia nana]
MTFAQLALSQLALWGVWSVVESVGVNLLLKIFYENPIRALRLKKPPSRTLAAESHRIAARMMIALGYFVYACWQVWQATEPSAYQKFGVSICASDKDIKRHFRDLAKMFHPDKVGAAGEVKFLQLHQIYEILSEPTLSFGAQAASWTQLSTPSEFVRQGVFEILYTQLHILFAQALAWLLHYKNYTYTFGLGTMWGLVLQATLFMMQLSMAISNTTCPYVSRVTGLTPFQCMSIMSRAFFPCVLLLQQLQGSLDKLLANGNWGHVRWASSDEPVFVESPEVLRKREITRLVRKRAENLLEANSQMELVAISAMQLQAQVHGCMTQDAGSE